MAEKGMDLDTKLRENEDVREIWKNRLEDNKEKNTATMIRFLPKAKNFKKSFQSMNT